MAIALSKHYTDRQYCIINADSAQVYDHLPILSAHPSAEELTQAEHRLYGYWDSKQSCSAVDWAKDAKDEINRAHDADKIPILVGGTGLYIRTLLDGIAPIPNIDPELRRSIRVMPIEESYNALIQQDPDAAQHLNPNDSARICRALEVIKSTGQSITIWRQQKEGGIADTITLQPLILLPPRDWLYERCNRRFVQMFDTGAIDEVEALIKRNPPIDSPLWRAIGVSEIKSYLEGQVERETAIELGQIATRQYAKRQYTWFRNQSPAHWHRHKEHINYNKINIFETIFQ